MAGLFGRLRGVARDGSRWLRARFLRKAAQAAHVDEAPSVRSAPAVSLRPGSIDDAELDPPEIEPDLWSADAGLAALSQTLSHRDPGVRASALALIAEFSEQQAGAVISAAMRDPDPRVRRAAASAAARVGTTAVLAGLIVALEDPSVTVRREAARSIEHLTGEPVVLSGPREVPSAEQVSALKAEWKRRRLAELSED